MAGSRVISGKILWRSSIHFSQGGTDSRATARRKSMGMGLIMEVEGA